MKKWCQWSWGLCLWASASVFASDLIWEGTNGTWQVGGGGWKLADGTPAVFQEGDSVTFEEAEGTVVVTVKGSFSVGDFLVDASNQYTIKGTSRNDQNGVLVANGVVTQAQSFTKRGTGKLRFELFSGNWTCPMYIEEGVFEGTYQVNYMDGVRVWNDTTPTNSFLGDLSVERDIVIGTPDTFATLQLFGDNRGNTPPYNQNSSPLKGVNQYTLTTPNVVPTARLVFENGLYNTNSARTVFGPIVLRNGSSIAKAKYDGSQRYFNGDIKVERRADNLPSNRASLVEPDTDGGNYFGIGTGAPIVFDVDEVTATADANGEVQDDGKTDLYIGLRIFDSTNELWPGKTGWTKRGPGTLEFGQAAAKCLSFGSDYTGDIVIEEGTVKVTRGTSGSYANLGVLGRVNDPNRTMTLFPGTTLDLCAQAFVHHGANAPTPKMTLVATNATILLNGVSTMPIMELYGTTQLKPQGHADGYGMMEFGDRTYFNLDYPLMITNLWNKPDNSNFICISYGTEQYTEDKTILVDGVPTVVQETFGFAEFCIEEAKNKTMGIADVILNTAVRNHSPNYAANERRHSGILKTGPGVLSLWKKDLSTARNNPNYYPGNTGPSIIREGGLLLDREGEIRTNVVVEAGAFIGGKGRVSGSLEIQEGGGFLVDATNLTAQLNVICDLSLPSEAMLMVYNYTHELTEVDRYLVNIPLPKVGALANVMGEPAEKNADNTIALDDYSTENWTVQLKGFDPKECRRHLRVVKNPDDTVSVDYTTGEGATLILR